jgi:hypothetical protein
MHFGDAVSGRRDAESGVERVGPAKAHNGGPIEAAAVPGRLSMAEFSLLLIFLGVTGLTYGLLSLPRSGSGSN